MRFAGFLCMLVASACALAPMPRGEARCATAPSRAGTVGAPASAAAPCSPAAPRPRPAAASPASRGLDYAALAGRLASRLSPLWNGRRYDPGTDSGATTDLNADLLTVFAIAAERGKTGAARDDARARAIVRFLTMPPIWQAQPPADDPGVRGPGWVSGPTLTARHPVHDSEVAEALAHAYSARAQLRLNAHSTFLIRSEIARVARGPDYAWPALRLNQINWPVDLVADDAQVSGRDATLARDLGRRLSQFLGDPSNFGAGMSFRYLPAEGPRARMNLDSPEYANIVLSASRAYRSARAAGMAPPRRLARLRDWVRRDIAGYWTHSGSLNWDTGLGFGRWQQRKKVSLAQEALIGIAATPELQPSSAYGAWAKWLLDRGLDEYAALADHDGNVPAAVAYGVQEPLEDRSMADLAAARYAANAMRALAAGLQDAPSAEPPALYSYDPGTGKLAISTPTYNTAIVPANQRAFPYGGLDIARLLDSDQEVAASTGGTGDAAFGLRVGGLRTQYGARSYGESPLHVDGIGSGPVHAGPFTTLRAHGSVSAGGLTASASYTFTPTTIDARWTATGHAPASVTFPSWGRTASVTARLCDGRTVTLRTARMAGICALRIHSARSGYTVAPTHPATAHLEHVEAQSADTNPGPTTVVELGEAPAAFAARITPGG